MPVFEVAGVPVGRATDVRQGDPDVLLDDPSLTDQIADTDKDVARLAVAVNELAVARQQWI